MKCPHCGEMESRVADSRPTSEGRAIRRRRVCNHCDGRFTTYERVESVPLMVIKKDGRREEFDRQKILRGLLTACEKRPISLATLENMIDQVEANLRNRMEQEVSSALIGELVMQGLREIDEIAYVRFASVYRQFGDVQRFMSELQKLLQQKPADQDLDS